MSPTSAVRSFSFLSTAVLAALLLGACGAPAPSETAPAVTLAPAATEPAPALPTEAASATTAQVALEEATALRVRPDQITYAVRVVNRSDAAVTGMTVRIEVPAGGRLLKILTHPGESDAESDDRAVTWTIPELPARSILGPFAYLVEIESDPGAVAVEAGWETPAAGSAETSIIIIDEATQSEVTMEMSAGDLSSIPGTGMQYFVPLGTRGEVTISRVDAESPEGTLEGLAWMGTYQVTKEEPGSVILVVPLLRPAAPYSLVRVFAGHADGTLLEQPVMGTISADGLHAAFPADGSSRYALGLDERLLGDRRVDPILMKTEELGQLENQIIDVGADIRQWVDEIDALAGVIGGSMDTGKGTSMGMSAGTYAAWRRHMDWFDDDYDNDGVTNGMELAAGSDPENPDSDGDSFTDFEEYGFSDPNDPSSVPDSIVGTECPPPSRCLFDIESGEMFAVANSILPQSIADLLAVGTPFQRGLEGQTTTLSTAGPAHVPPAGAILDAADLRGVVAVAEDSVVLFIPGGQRVQVIVGGGQHVVSAEATAPPGLASATSGPTYTPTHKPAATRTPTPKPTNTPLPPSQTAKPTATRTPTPAPTNTPADTQGPIIANLVADPPQVFTGGTSAIAADVSDPSGLASVQVRWKYQGEGPWRETLGMLAIRKGGQRHVRAIPSTGGFPQLGTVVFEVVAIDKVGNASIAGGTINVVIP